MDIKAATIGGNGSSRMQSISLLDAAGESINYDPIYRGGGTWMNGMLWKPSRYVDRNCKMHKLCIDRPHVAEATAF